MLFTEAYLIEQYRTFKPAKYIAAHLGLIWALLCVNKTSQPVEKFLAELFKRT